MRSFSSAAHSADDFQVRRAQALCAGAPSLQAELETFLRTEPNRAQMDDYLKQLKAGMATDLAAALLGKFTLPPA